MKEVLESLTFRNEEEAAKLKPNKSYPKEVPFNKNNPKEKEMQASAPHADSGAGQAQPMTQRQREIEALKRSLLAPPGQRGVVAPAPPQKEEEKKFNKVMDWGTPRLVTKNRELVMNAKTMQQRELLNKFASIRNGPVPD